MKKFYGKRHVLRHWSTGILAIVSHCVGNMIQSDGRCTQSFFVIGELLQKTDLSTRRRDCTEIVLAHLLVNEIEQHLPRARHAIERQMTIVDKR